jgi:hypothetical protein
MIAIAVSVQDQNAVKGEIGRDRSKSNTVERIRRAHFLRPGSVAVVAPEDERAVTNGASNEVMVSVSGKVAADKRARR